MEIENTKKWNGNTRIEIIEYLRFFKMMNLIGRMEIPKNRSLNTDKYKLAKISKIC